MKINLPQYCPLNSKEAIQKLLNEIEFKRYYFSDYDIGQVLIQNPLAELSERILNPADWSIVNLVHVL